MRKLSLGLAALAGALFGAGLVIGGMTDPAVVTSFLDLGGDWNPTLAFVLAGGLGVYAVVFRSIRRRAVDPWFAEKLHLPTRADVDRRLVLGAILFGAGWGLAGVCPGPGVVALGGGTPQALVFVAAMLAGMIVERRLGT